MPKVGGKHFPYTAAGYAAATKEKDAIARRASKKVTEDDPRYFTRGAVKAEKRHNTELRLSVPGGFKNTAREAAAKLATRTSSRRFQRPSKVRGHSE